MVATAADKVSEADEIVTDAVVRAEAAAEAAVEVADEAASKEETFAFVAPKDCTADCTSLTALLAEDFMSDAIVLMISKASSTLRPGVEVTMRMALVISPRSLSLNALKQMCEAMCKYEDKRTRN